MPYYEYECRDCGEFSEFRSIAERNVPVPCQFCKEPSQRIISAPNLSLMSPLKRMAATRNEKSRHEPRVGGPKKSCCSSSGSCSHKRTGLKMVGDKPALRASTKKNRRPWMLGH